MYVDICLLVCCLFFFFKQKTAYEMRISDWSSDVCSSDLHDLPLLRARFGVSMEQLAHRLTSLGRTGARGVPFFMAKVDRARSEERRVGKECAVRVDLGGRRIIKKKKEKPKREDHTKQKRHKLNDKHHRD